MKAAVILLLAASAFLCGSYAQARQPVVTITYDAAIDAQCASDRGVQIPDEWKAELMSRLPEFENLWRTFGPKLVEATETITGKAFSGGSITARLTLCDLPSQSFDGISVNMRFALKSFTPTPVPMRYKVDTLFHELLHVFLTEHPVKESALLEQNKSEPERTRNHLHLLALQKAVLLKLNEPEALKTVVTIDSQLPGGYYKRAWEIVNASDDEYLKYVAEISR
jgi:hypothetical protein